MGKRSDFERVEKDYYATPYKAMEPLLDYLHPVTYFIDPCAGDNRMHQHLKRHGHKCIAAYDLEPKHPEVLALDALTVNRENIEELVHPNALEADCFITNPPWSRHILHPLIETYAAIRPTWFLFDADWAHTKQATPYMDYCMAIVSVGRIKWIEDSKYFGKDNCAWYCFNSEYAKQETLFYGRQRAVG